jgi:hypothetical protein
MGKTKKVKVAAVSVVESKAGTVTATLTPEGASSLAEFLLDSIDEDHGADLLFSTDGYVAVTKCKCH